MKAGIKTGTMSCRRHYVFVYACIFLNACYKLEVYNCFSILKFLMKNTMQIMICIVFFIRNFKIENQLYTYNLWTNLTLLSWLLPEQFLTIKIQI